MIIFPHLTCTFFHFSSKSRKGSLRNLRLIHNRVLVIFTDFLNYNGTWVEYILCPKNTLERNNSGKKIRQHQGGGRELYCFPPTFLDPFRLPVWRHIVTGKSLRSLVQISMRYNSYSDERDRAKAKKLANIAIYR